MIYTKIFLICNDLSDIQVDNNYIWKRLEVVKFAKDDLNLNSTFDVTWKQTFINMLIEYYYKDVDVPDEVILHSNK